MVSTAKYPVLDCIFGQIPGIRTDFRFNIRPDRISGIQPISHPIHPYFCRVRAALIQITITNSRVAGSDLVF